MDRFERTGRRGAKKKRKRDELKRAERVTPRPPAASLPAGSSTSDSSDDLSPLLAQMKTYLTYSELIGSRIPVETILKQITELEWSSSLLMVANMAAFVANGGGPESVAALESTRFELSLYRDNHPTVLAVLEAMKRFDDGTPTRAIIHEQVLLHLAALVLLYAGDKGRTASGTELTFWALVLNDHLDDPEPADSPLSSGPPSPALKEAFASVTGTERIRFTTEQWGRLAVKGKVLTPRERETCCQVVRPETILAWFRRLAAAKYDGSKVRRAGRPEKGRDVRALVVRLARENPRWGYTKIRDALRGLGIEIGRTAVADILGEAGIEPAPERGRRRTWKTFIQSHIETLYACDFFAVETLGAFRAIRHLVYVVIELKSRAVEIAGVAVNPDGRWMEQVARGLLDPVDGFLRRATHVVHDRDPLYTTRWKALLASRGVESVPTPAKSPNCNAVAERFIRTVREECLDNFVIVGERHLRHLLKEFVAHYHEERYHQGLDNRIIRPTLRVANDNLRGRVGGRARLGGVLNYYNRRAA